MARLITFLLYTIYNNPLNNTTMKLYSYKTPERPIDSIFNYNGKRYVVKDASSINLTNKSIGCTKRDPITGNILENCVFCNYCGRVNQRHRGYCTPNNRSDGKTVYFVEI